ncbi:MAG: Rne/Rng family ribonuclease [Candidatus Brocadiaceae bacterium]|jgi:ribonuclease E
MEKEMLINVVEEEEVRIALIEDSRLEDLYLERTGREHIVGNINKGIVVNLVPNLEAAFVEFGYRKHGFLHASDVLPHNGKKGRSNNIRRLLDEGEEILVQVTKEGFGDKGPSLTTYLSLPGRYLVLMPGLARRGVSRRIDEDDERRRLRGILKQLDIPDGMGVIARTAGEGRSKADLEKDLDYLLRLWRAISQRAKRSDAPALVYQESDPVTRVIRDAFTEDIRRIIVDSEDVHDKVKEFLRAVLPRHVRKVKLHTSPDPLFHHYGVEDEIEKMHSRTVQLPSGGSIVLEQTEALVAIDVNSGTYKGRGDAEETAFQINMEAAPEIARQVRLRDLGGVVVMDFIDMARESHRAKVQQTLKDALERDRARLRVLKMSPFCIVEMTRQRQKQSLRQSTYVECPHCHGTGYLKGPETLALQVLRQVKAGMDLPKLASVRVLAPPQAANYLNNEMRRRIQEITEASGKQIRIIADATLDPGEHKVQFLNPDGREIVPG